MKKNLTSIISICLVIVMAVCLGFSIHSNYKTCQELDALKATLDSINISETTPTDVNEDTEPTVPKNVTVVAYANPVIGHDENGFYATGSIRLTNENGTAIIVVPSSMKVTDYDSESNVVHLNNGAIKIRLTDTFTSADIHRFTDESTGKTYLSAEKFVSEGMVLSIVAESTEETQTANMDIMTSIINSVAIDNGTTEAELLNYAVDANKWNHLVIANDYVIFEHDENTICVSTFDDETTGAGFDNELEIEDLTFVYSDIVDEETNLRPYLVTIGDTQYKILVTDNDMLMDFYTIGEEPVEETVPETSEEGIG